MNLTLCECLLTAMSDSQQSNALPNKNVFNFTDLKRSNLKIAIKPAAIMDPQHTGEIATVVKCAAYFQLHAQARSGIYSYGKYSMYHCGLLNIHISNKPWRQLDGRGAFD